MKKNIILLILFSVLTLNAAEINFPLKKNIKIDDISKNKTWERLLYIENEKSQIVSEDFFLTNKKNFNKKEELIKTINDYEVINKNDFNLSSRCKFPARYYWLSSFVDFPNYNIIDKRCTNLLKYKSLNEVKSVSLILVSGYLGNPASTFGHSFIKLNQNTNDDLFDTSVNYGALVPENENIVKYIFKGILGGYEAGFSDKYFYTQDLVYNHTEFRDMWDYKLNLKDEEKTLLLLHLWEVIGKKFDYYFLDKNCGYRVSQIVELLLNKDIIESNKPWYPPVDTFYKLEELNKSENIIDSVTYIPSYQLTVYKKYDNLNKEERIIVKDLISNDFNELDKIGNLNMNTQIKVVNFLVDYIKYLEIKNKNDKKFLEVKNKILLKRLSLPISSSKDIHFQNRLSPARNNKPMVFSFGSNNYENLKSYRTLGFTPFSIESLGTNNLDFSSLSVFRTSFGFNSEKTFLEKFELIDIRKVNKLNTELEKKHGLSWNLNMGITKINRDDKLKNSMYMDTSIGKSKFIKDNFLVYSMLNSSFFSKESEINLRPYLGLNYSFTKDLKSSFELGYSFSNRKNKKYVNTEWQYNYNKKYAISLEYSDEEYSNLRINFKWFFR